jgi:hypothetical protein
LRSLSRSTIDLSAVRRGDPMTIYIVIPPDKLESHGALLRLWVGALMLTVMGRRRRPKRSTLFLLDECAQLGEFGPLRQSMTLLRGYGLQVWPFFQDLSQLQRLYPKDWRTIFNNAGVFQLFGVANHLMAKESADLIGDIDADILRKMAKDRQVIAAEFALLHLLQFMTAVNHHRRMAEMGITAQVLTLTLHRSIAEEGHRVAHPRRIREIFTVKAVDDVTISMMLGLGIALDDGEQVKALPGLKEELVGALDNRADIRAVQIAVDVIETDEGHEIEAGRPAAEEGENLAPIEIVKGVDRLLSEEGMTLGFEKDPQSAARLLDRNHAPVDRNIADFAGIEIGQDRSQRLSIVFRPAFKQTPVIGQVQMLNAEDGHSIFPEALRNKV